MAQPPKSRSRTRTSTAGADRSAPAAGATPIEARAIAIRDHVVPLIRALAGAQRAGGLPVLIAVLGPYTFTYRRPLVGERDKPHHLEIRRRRRLMVLEWGDEGIRRLSLIPGAWEQEVMRLTRT